MDIINRPCLPIIAILSITFFSPSLCVLDNLNVPCKYLDSINITDGIFDEGSNTITHNEIVYDEHNWGIYDYEFVNETYRQPVEPHRRGCLCKMRTCVRMCCPRGEYFQEKCRQNDTAAEVKITVENEEISLFDEFHYVTGKPCHYINQMTPEDYPTDVWSVFKNGTILLDSKLLNKNQYCLNPKYNYNSTEVEATLWTCFEAYDGLKYSVLPFGMFISIPFLIVTFLIYAILPELRNVHGKSLMCYLLCLIVGYTFLSVIQLNKHSPVEPVLCRSIGYTIYFSFLSAFFWLSVISFDLWWNFRGMTGINKLADTKKFLIYSGYAWGCSVSIVGLCLIIDSNSFISTQYQPGFGINSCFLQKSRITEFLYFYSIIIIIICFNSTFFILTAIKIRKVQLEMLKVTAKEDSRRHQKNLDNEKDKFGLFLRLFIVMGVTWTMEAISWAIDPNNNIFFLTDICNTVQGLVIFILFVMKPKVKHLLIKRWYIWRGEKVPQKRTSSSVGSTRLSSNATTTTSMNPNATERSLMTDIRD